VVEGPGAGVTVERLVVEQERGRPDANPMPISDRRFEQVMPGSEGSDELRPTDRRDLPATSSDLFVTSGRSATRYTGRVDIADISNGSSLIGDPVDAQRTLRPRGCACSPTARSARRSQPLVLSTLVVIDAVPPRQPLDNCVR
jgi:hypothetical protein